jgi:Flp pilus assembly protein TadG
MKCVQGENGQAMVEFALVITILFFIVLGALDLGRAFHATIVITNASREGMRYLTLHPTDSTSGFAGTKNAAIAEAQGSSITLTAGQITVPLCIDIDPFAGCDSGTRARVTVTYPFRLILAFFINTPFNITRSTEMIIP